MSSHRRIIASQANGRLSRGPTTPEGKARSAQNALRHGFLSNCVVLPNESDENFKLLFSQYLDRFDPDAVECGMVEEMAASYWRMRRLWAIETQSLAEAIAMQPPGPETARIAAGFRQLAVNPEMALLQRYETRLHLMFNRAFQNFLLMRSLAVENEPDADIPNEPSPISEHPQALPEPTQTPSIPPPAPTCAIVSKVTLLESWLADLLAAHDAVSGTVHLAHNGGLKLAAAINIPEKVQQIVAFVPNGKGMAGLALQQGIPIQTCNLKEDASGAVKPGAKAVDAKAAIAIPVKASNGSVRAVVGIAFPNERQFSESDLATLTKAAATLP